MTLKKEMQQAIKDFLIDNKSLIEQEDWQKLYDRIPYYTSTPSVFTPTLTNIFIKTGLFHEIIESLTELPAYFAFGLNINNLYIPENIKVIKICALSLSNNSNTPISMSNKVQFIDTKTFGYFLNIEKLHWEGSKSEFETVLYNSGWTYNEVKSLEKHTVFDINE